jgi:adenosylhomocysteine nucleosidase
MDAAHRDLPRSAFAAVRADGTIDLVALLRSVARNPSDLPLLLRTARDAMVGFAALLRCRPMLGPGLGLPGFAIPARPSAELSGPAFCRLEEPCVERP